MAQRAFFPLIIALALLAGAGVSYAQQVQERQSNFALSNDEPIQIESDQLEVSEADSRAHFTGNVNVVQGDMVLKSGEMTVFYSGETGSVSTGTAAIERIEMENSVYLQSGAQTASADSGVYDMESEVLTLSGDRVVLSEADNVLVGCKLTVQVASGNARLESCGDRVQIQINPNAGRNN